MRANEKGVKAPKANTTKVFQNRLIARFNEFLNLESIGLFVAEPAVIQVANKEIIVLERQTYDYGTRGMGAAPMNVECYMGFSKHSSAMARQRDDLISTAVWMGIAFYTEIGVVTTAYVRTDTHSEETEVFSAIAKESHSSDWDGWYAWAACAEAVTLRMLGRIEYTRIWMQRTYSEEYTRKGIKYGSGWDDSEWEESFQVEEDEDQ